MNEQDLNTTIPVNVTYAFEVAAELLRDLTDVPDVFQLTLEV